LSAYLSDITHISKATAAQRESSQDLVEEHLQLLETSEKTLDVIRDTTAVQEASKPLLFHPDSHARNIFVDPNDPTKILSIIDWQSTVIEPAFIHANETPDFAEEPVLDKILDAEVSPEVQEAQDHAQRCGSTWAVMAYICPKLGKAITLDYDLCCYLAGISSGCSDDITSLRSLLTDVSNRWEDLELPGVCPYQPSEEEAKMLSLELDHLQSTQRMRMYLSRMLRCETDGWVEKGRWDEVVPNYRDQYAKFVESCIESREEDETEEDAVRKADKLWPFDLR
jgi:hypothetical protein